MKGRGLLIIGMSLCCLSVSAFAENESYNGITFDIPSTWEEVSVGVYEAPGYIEIEFSDVPYGNVSTVTDSMFTAKRNEIRKTAKDYLELSSEKEELNGVTSYTTIYYDGEDLGFLESYDTGASILNVNWVVPEGTEYSVSNAVLSVTCNPNTDNWNGSNANYSASIDTLIRSSIRSKLNEYDETKLNTIDINKNTGSDDPDDYIALINLTWNVKNSSKTTEEMLRMYSDDLAASLCEEYQELSEITIFWKVPYLTDGTSKWAYERQSDKMYLTDTVISF